MALHKKRLRPITFDAEDLSRITKAVAIHFLTVGFTNPKPPWATYVYFHPYPESSPDPHGIGLESVVFLAPRPKINLRHAKDCLEYLGFDEEFKKNFIKLYEVDQEGELSGTEVFDESFLFAVWWEFLAATLTKELKGILTPDASSKEKWKRRRAGRPWKGVSLRGAHSSMAKITKQLFIEEFNHRFTEEALEQKIARWKRERAKED